MDSETVHRSPHSACQGRLWRSDTPAWFAYCWPDSPHCCCWLLLGSGYLLLPDSCCPRYCSGWRQGSWGHPRPEGEYPGAAQSDLYPHHLLDSLYHWNNNKRTIIMYLKRGGGKNSRHIHAENFPSAVKKSDSRNFMFTKSAATELHEWSLNLSCGCTLWEGVTFLSVGVINTGKQYFWVSKFCFQTVLKFFTPA